MRSKLLIALTLLLAVVKTNYTIEIKCGYYNCGDACNQCQVFNGGPFSKYAICVDSPEGCTADNTFNISFACKGCNNSNNDCSYTV